MLGLPLDSWLLLALAVGLGLGLELAYYSRRVRRRDLRARREPGADA